MILKANGNGNVCKASTKKRNVRIGFLGKIDMSKGFLSIRNIFMDPCNNINRFIGPPPSKWMCIRILFVIKVFTYVLHTCKVHFNNIDMCTGQCTIKTGYVHVRHIGSRYIYHQATIGLGLVCPVIWRCMLSNHIGWKISIRVCLDQ